MFTDRLVKNYDCRIVLHTSTLLALRNEKILRELIVLYAVSKWTVSASNTAFFAV